MSGEVGRDGERGLFDGRKKFVMAGWRKGEMPLMFQAKIRMSLVCRSVIGPEGRDGARAVDSADKKRDIEGVAGGEEVAGDKNAAGAALVTDVEDIRRCLEGGGLMVAMSFKLL